MEKITKLIVLILFAFLFTDCKKENLLDDAQLIGIDFRLCASPHCGGYWIEIDECTLRFLNFPEDSDLRELGSDANFPIQVEVKWRWPTEEDFQDVEDLIVVESINKK